MPFGSSFSRLAGVPVDPDVVFVLMPFNAQFEPVFEVIRRAGDEARLKTIRADEIIASGTIIDQIFEGIARSALVVADLTLRNQNVMYELGLAHSMNNEVILLY